MILYVLFFLSGAAGLVYELLWVHRLTLIMGGTTHAITTVLAAFMGGLALGSFLAGRRAARLASPLRAYGLLEIAIGLSALLIELGFSGAVPLYRFVHNLVGPERFILLHAVRFFASGLLLLLPTACMGATLPILVEHGVRRDRRFGNVTGTFYGINTIGAAIGAAIGGFLLIPMLGRHGALLVAVIGNLSLGTAALLIRSRLERGAAVDRTEAEPEAREAPAPGAGMGPLLRGLVILTVGVSGFAAMAYQIAWTRILLVQVGSSVYAFTSVLVVFIIGLGLGAFAIGLTAHRIRRPVFALGIAEAALGLSALWILPHFTGFSERVVEWLREMGATGPEFLAKQFMHIFAILIVPTLVLGTTFPLVVYAITRMHREASRNVGIAYSVNTIGTIFGSVVAGFYLLAGPAGITGTIGIAIALSAGLGIALLLAEGRAPLRLRAGTLVLLLVLLALRVHAAMEKPLDRATLTAGAFLGSLGDTGEILYYRDGADATISVHEPPWGGRTLRINGKPDASTGLADMPTQVAIAQVPLLLASNPERVLVVGLGGGVTMASAAAHSRVRAIDVLEISDAVIEAARVYFGPYLRGAFDDPRVRILRNDGRNHLLLTPENYDVIVSEPSNPWLAGIPNLFTKEYFELARSRLRPGGVYCQWLQSYGMAPSDFLLVVRTIISVFPNVSLWQGQYSDFFLVAREETGSVPLDTLALRMLETDVYRDLESVGLEHPGRILGACLADHDVLSAWAGRGPLNTDINGRLEFSAPLQRLRNDSPQLAASLARRGGDPLESFILADLEGPDHRSVLDLADRNRRGVFAVYQASKTAPDRATLLQVGEELYRSDPADWRTYRMVVSAADVFETERAGGPQLRMEEARFVERVRALPEPATGPLTPAETKSSRVGAWLEEA
ncbi:MAG: fused MFS/spermidine synthase, partial [Candidatus Eisenbacteria bacterium]